MAENDLIFLSFSAIMLFRRNALEIHPLFVFAGMGEMARLGTKKQEDSCT